MLQRVVFDEDRCKACELCIGVCPKNIIVLADHWNKQGYHPAMVVDQSKCTSCALCALMCPDVVIEVWKESRSKKGGNHETDPHQRQ